MTTTLLPIALFKNREDNVPRQQEWAWEVVRERLLEHAESTTKNIRLWSPALYRPDTKRAIANVESIALLVFDFDNGAHPERFEDEWEPYEYVIHSSYSHTPEKPKWRAVFPLAKSIPGVDWAKGYQKLALALGQGQVDPSCRDAARMFYVPSCPPGGARFARAHSGEWLD